MKCTISIDGRLNKRLKLDRRQLKAAAVFFAAKSANRSGLEFREVALVLQDDAQSDEVHRAIMDVAGATDVITQRYDAMPGEEQGVYGELYVNADRALLAAPSRSGWSAEKELLLYVAHGMDHLAGEDDLDESGRKRMRRRELAWVREFCEGNCW